jgi:beta-glucanase (GH16 family)
LNTNPADSIAGAAQTPPIQPTQEVQTLFADDFSAPLSTTNWDYNHFEDGGSFYGQTQQRQSLPVDSNGVLHLQLDTFNPTGPGTSFLGSEVISVPTFTNDAGGVAFEVTARLASPVPGLVGGFFGFDLVDPATGIHNEVDTELLGNDAAAGINQVNTNVYSNDPPGSGHPAFVPVSDVTAFHTYRMEWFPDRVRWFVDGQFVREDRADVPQGALELRLNIWVPDASWGDAYSASLQPASSAAANATYDVQVDSVRVAQLAPLPADGGRWVFSPPAGFSGLVLGINNGVAPVFPTAKPGAFNIEIFSNSALAGQQGVPNPDSGFQSSIADPGATLDNGFLTGTDLRLTTGDFLLVDSVTGASTQGPSKVTLGSGNQTVVGAISDTLVGGSGNQILSALLGNQTVVGGSGNASIWGGAGDSIVAGSGADQQIVVTDAATTVVAGIGGSAVVALSLSDTVTALAGSQNIGIAAGISNLIDLTGNSGAATFVIGTGGDTIIGGNGSTGIDGSAGGMSIKVGADGITAVSGSTSAAAGNTIAGGAGAFNYNPGAVAGKGELINLSGGTGTATINAFSFQGTRITSPDTILGTNNADSVFGGDGDRIGTGSGSVVGGTHQWTHADTVPGSAVGFGSNDTVSSTTYDPVSGVATRGTADVTSSAQVTVGGFNATTDFIFYQTEDATTTNAIIATAQATTVGGTAGTIVTLPDGTVMTLVGITQAQLTPALFKP